METFWGGKKDLARRDELQVHMPVMGEVTDKSRPMLEEWRKLQNAYYRYYNDGDAFYNKLRHMGRRFGMPKFADSLQDLECLADRVLAAAYNEMKELEDV